MNSLCGYVAEFRLTRRRDQVNIMRNNQIQLFEESLDSNIIDIPAAHALRKFKTRNPHKKLLSVQIF